MKLANGVRVRILPIIMYIADHDIFKHVLHNCIPLDNVALPSYKMSVQLILCKCMSQIFNHQYFPRQLSDMMAPSRGSR